MLFSKEDYKDVLKCIQENFDDPVKFQSEMKTIAMDLFKTTIYDTQDIYSFGELLYAMLHFDGISVTLE